MLSSSSLSSGFASDPSSVEQENPRKENSIKRVYIFFIFFYLDLLFINLTDLFYSHAFCHGVHVWKVVTEQGNWAFIKFDKIGRRAMASPRTIKMMAIPGRI